MRSLAIFLMIVFTTIGCSKKIGVSLVTATSMDSGLAFDVLNEKEWRPEVNAEYVKFHIYADEPIKLSKVKIQSCSGSFNDSIELFVNFDEIIKVLKNEGSSASETFPEPITARSLTFNFQKNSNLCISKIQIFDEKDKELKWKTPNIVEGKVTASEKGGAESSYGVMNLFDSRYEYAYASKTTSAGVYLQFNFEKEERIEALKIWNGYQRSDVHCIENGRIKKLTLEGDGYNEEVTLSDEMGPQEIKLPKAFKGKDLKVTVKEAFPGKKFPGIVISELRFHDGKNWFLLNPFPRIKEIASNNLTKFKEAGISSILNKNLVGYDHTGNTILSEEEQLDKIDSQNRRSSDWTLRLRSDGSMFIEGTTSRDSVTDLAMEVKNNHFFGLGNYEILSSSEGKSHIKIFGFLRTIKTTELQDFHGDCNGCGRDCNKVYTPDPNKVEKIFSEELELYENNGKYYIKNYKKTKNLDFEILEMNLI
ncbi:MAG: discoidin domain-containing protein [Leptospiraceae bacterium]|nr:discoidin domain-containing protein [Leptospiraceae bacterium]